MNFEQPRFWILQILGWSLFAFGSYWIFQQGSSDPLFALSRNLILTGTGFAITILFRSIYKKLLTRSLRFSILALAAIVTSLLFGAVWIIALECFTWILFPESADPQFLIQFGAKAAFNNSFILLAWSALYFGIKNWQDLQIQKERTLRATALAHEAQLHMLRYQLNPHFLFNALNSVRALIAENPVRAQNMVTELSEFLRYTLNSRNNREVTLREEVECIRNYLTIEKIRYEEKLHIELSIPEQAEDCKVPAFLIHPLIENAIKHGMRTSRLPLNVRIDVQHLDGQIGIRVANTGSMQGAKSPGTDSHGTGTGLRNVRERLEQVHPGKHDFKISENNGWVEATIYLPFTTAGDGA